MSTLLKPGQKPQMQVVVNPTGTSRFLHHLAEYAPAVERLLTDRPRDLGELSSRTRDGLRLRDQLDATLEELS